MAEFPALPLFTDAYFGDTRHLSCTEHGAYLQLLMVAWRSRECSLPNDDRKLAKYVGLTARQWERIKETILDFFEIENDCLIQRRLRDEYDLVKRKREAAVLNGQASALKRQARHSAGRKRSVNGASTPKPKPKEDSPDGESNPPPLFVVPQPEWGHYADYRKRIGKPLTKHGVKLAMARLGKLETEGNDPREVLNQSIMNGWTGLFQIKEDRNGMAGRQQSGDGLSPTTRAANRVFGAAAPSFGGDFSQ